MRKGFNLIEVLISCAIIGVVALALLQTHSHNVKFINRIQNQHNFKDLFSIVLLNEDMKFNGSSKHLNDFVEEFKIKDDELLNILKNAQFKYHHDKLSSIDLFDSKIRQIADEIGIDRSKIPEISIMFDKITAEFETSSSIGYKVYIP